MRRSLEPATALRAALASPWPELQRAAGRIIWHSTAGRTLTEAANHLGVSRRTLERIRADYPRAFWRTLPPSGRHDIGGFK